MKLIVDSGSTKTDWCFADSSDVYVLVHTDGINPVVQSYDGNVVCCSGTDVATCKAAVS